MTSFVLGQRWVSDTESELGLGIIDTVTARTVTVYFPAIDEKRIYSQQSPPLSRIIFNKNDKICSTEKWSLQIEELYLHQGIIIYVGTRCDNQTRANLVESNIDSQMQYSQPQLRLFAGQVDRSDHFIMRYQSLVHRNEQYRLPYRGLRGMRTNLIPHQLFIAQEVGQRSNPRVLLADEVGLGKTIEAGMILHQRLLTGMAQRVLIIVPHALQYQWLVEMLRRFNLHFALFDKERYVAAYQDSACPFDTEQLVLCSLEFVRDNVGILTALLASQWDMLVVDEAHHLVWTQELVSHEYEIVEQLSQHIPSVLLLTATPEQLGEQSHFARLRLLDPARFHDYTLFTLEQQKFQPVAALITTLLSEEDLQSSEIESLITILDDDIITQLQIQTINSRDITQRTAVRQQLIQILMDRHGTSRILFRNTRHSIQGFPQRHYHPIEIDYPLVYQTLFDESKLLLDTYPIERQLFFRLYPEQLYQQLLPLSKAWFEVDSRVDWLIDYLQTHILDKIVLICHHKKTALDLGHYLQQKYAIRTALFHEDMSILERDRAVAYFASQEAPSAQILICSEIASEGRNFQFSHIIVLFDLPLNPDLLEQRIGRLDRIGQQQNIDIFVPYFSHTAQAKLANWYHHGLNAFELCCSIGHLFYTQSTTKWYPLLLTPADSEEWQQFILTTQRQAQQILTQLASGRDKLLELQSSGGSAGEYLLQSIQQDDHNTTLQHFASKLFDLIGIHQQDKHEGILQLIPSNEMLLPDFPGIPEDGFEVTFQRNQALKYEDSQFITWEHPLITNGLDLFLSTDTGRCCVNLLLNKKLPIGTVILELIYIVDTQAPRHLQLQRFLPPTPLRIVLDQQGNDLASQITFDTLHEKLKNVDRNMAIAIIKLVRPMVEKQLQHAESIAQQQAQQLIHHAKEKAEQALTLEINRLMALQKVNPTIRPQEIEQLQQQRQQLLEYIAMGNVYLDSLCLITTAHL